MIFRNWCATNDARKVFEVPDLGYLGQPRNDRYNADTTVTGDVTVLNGFDLPQLTTVYDLQFVNHELIISTIFGQ